MTIIHASAVDGLRQIPTGSVHTCITSPPYFGLRSYLPADHPDKALEIGLEDTPDAFVARLVEVFRQVRRVLRDDGTLWVNLGDSYATGTKASRKPTTISGPEVPASWAGRSQPERLGTPAGYKTKDLLGLPWRVAFALQADGWFLRQDIIWHKPNPMPESVTDRCTKAHEYIFLFSKSPRYFFDSFEMQEEAVGNPSGNTLRKSRPTQQAVQRGDQKGSVPWEGGPTRNRRSVWTVTTKPFKGAHFATFPPDLIEPCVRAGAPEKCCPACGAPWERVVEKGAPDLEHQIACGGDATKARILAGMVKKTTTGFTPTCTHGLEPVAGTVLDPFFGAGTTGLVAQRHGRKWLGVELNTDYIAIAKDRLGLRPRRWELEVL